jgi:hypothetical protein
MGLCYQRQKDYEHALVCFKSLMHSAWIYDSTDYEIQAFEHISLQYYYMGMIEKSSWYHMKMVKGSDPSDRPTGYGSIISKS